MSKIITVYFSIKGQTLGPGMTIVNQEKGNTAMAAEFIHHNYAEKKKLDLHTLLQISCHYL